MSDPIESPAAVSGVLGKNVVFLATSNLLAPLFSLVLVLAIAHLRGVEELGKYSLVMTVFVLGQSCAGFGLPLVITREVAQRRDAAGRYFSSSCIVTLAMLTPILMIAFPVLHATMADRELSGAIYLVLVALTITSVNVYGEAVLLAFEHARDFVLINMGETILRAITGVVLVLAGFGVTAVVAGLLFFRILAAGAYLIVLRRRGVHFESRPDRALCRDLLRHVPVVGLIPIVNAIYSRADIFLLTSLASWADVGMYSAAMRFIDLAKTIAPAYARALYPVLARLRVGPEAEYQAVVQRALRTILLMTAPIVVVLFGAGGWLVTLLYGPNLVGAVPSLHLLALTLLPVALAFMLAQVLFSANRQAIDLRVNVIASVVSVAAGFVLIPRLGAAGAATSTLLAASVYTTLQYFWTRQYVTDPRALGDIAKIMASALAACAVMVLVPPHGAFFATTLGMLCYGAALLSLGVVQREDLARFRLLAASAAGRVR